MRAINEDEAALLIEAQFRVQGWTLRGWLDIFGER
jgi:hypothetical protein